MYKIGTSMGGQTHCMGCLHEINTGKRYVPCNRLVPKNELKWSAKRKKVPLYSLVDLSTVYNIFTDQQQSANEIVSLPQHDGSLNRNNVLMELIDWTKLTLFLVLRSFKKLLMTIREMGFHGLFLRGAITNLSVCLKHFNFKVDTLGIANSNLSGM